MRRIGIATALTIGLVAVACGDSGTDATDGGTSSSSTSSSTSSSGTIDSGTTSSSSSSSTSSSSSGGNDGGVAEAGAKCAANSCNAHGTCADTTGSIVCTCTTGYAGATCDTCAAGFQDKDGDKTCKGACAAGTCSSHGTCSDATGTAVCTCTAEYTGGACDTCAAGYQDKDNDKTCKPACAANTCNSHGSCVDTTGTAVCTCTGNFTGADCNTCKAGFQGANCDTCVADKFGPNCDYSMVYSLDIPLAADWNANADVPYTVNNDGVGGAFSRVAYRLTLDNESVWAEMDAFTANKNELGVPATAIFDGTAVTNVTVISKAANVVNQGPVTGQLEFWKDCYSTGGGNASLYDYRDTRSVGTACYGSMQLSIGTDMIFSYNRWSAGGNSDMGFGNQPAASGQHPDWTFKQNSASFAARKLEVFVK